MVVLSINGLLKGDIALADSLLPGPLSVLVPVPRLLDLKTLDGALGVVLLVDLDIVIVCY